MTAQPRTLEQMINRPTAYEVALVVDGKVIDILAYTARQTRSVLLSIAQDHGPRIANDILKTDDFECKYAKATGWVFGGRVQVKFTGWTERSRRSQLMGA